MASLAKIDSPLFSWKKRENADLTWNKVVRFYVILLELFASHAHTECIFLTIWSIKHFTFFMDILRIWELEYYSGF